MGMGFLRGDETPAEMIVLAYGMEEGLEQFYLTAARTMEMDAPEVNSLLRKLAGFEEQHKKRLFDLYLQIQPGDANRKNFEASIVPGVMEGGFTTEEFLAKNRHVLQSVPDLLCMAMMLEAQAMDLFMRYAHKISGKEGQGIFEDLAEEEKAHLQSLGRLMEENS